MLPENRFSVCEDDIEAHLNRLLRDGCHPSITEADTAVLHRAVIAWLTALVHQRRMESQDRHGRQKRALYLSAEYLTGRMLPENLEAAGLTEPLERVLARHGRSLREFELVPDPGLGNGGLGRLAACFLESAATHDLPLDGYGIRYRYGIFRQRFRHGFQQEEIDNWTEEGEDCTVPSHEPPIPVTYGDMTVLAVAYDMPILGYGTDNIGTLRLFDSRPFRPFDLEAFNSEDYIRASREAVTAADITRILYPTDCGWEGKKLRLRQEYFLASASVQDMLRCHLRHRPNDTAYAEFAAYHAIQLNDTHPVMAIPELIRLMTAAGCDFDTALSRCGVCFHYTNHPIMAEALEKWDMGLVRQLLPQLTFILEELDRRCRREAGVAIIENGALQMARLAVYVSRRVNGVAALHSHILKKHLFADWHRQYPEKFQSITNGVSQRRFLCQANPQLSSWIGQRLGSDRFIKDLTALTALSPLADDAGACREFAAIKAERRRILSDYVRSRDGIIIDPDSIIDVQIKRLHEYKRQLMNILAVLSLYFSFKEGLRTDQKPVTFLFGGKAAPSYRRAKLIIKLIHEVSDLIAADPEADKIMRVVFLENYDVSYAERVVAAADISEQISTAGTEASGTGNMKMMMNGAVTLGTYDGANIEIFSAAGEQSNYRFGSTMDELVAGRDCYRSHDVYLRHPVVRQVVDALTSGLLGEGENGCFRELRDSLLYGVGGECADRYRVLLDLPPYLAARKQIFHDCTDTVAFAAKGICNMAASGIFSSDRAVKHYADHIWQIKPVAFD